MILLSLSAAFVGLVHSLAPGHWLPVVLVTKSRRWSIRKATIGALVAASGHILISNFIGVVSIVLGSHFLADMGPEMEHKMESYAGIMLLVFGLIYATIAYRRHSGCHGHTHHGPDIQGSGVKKRDPFVFLFLLGFSPCLAVLPVFAAAATRGVFATMMTMWAFSLGVITALVGATLITNFGLMKLDHPVFEHYGDVITGASVAVMGIVLFFI